MGSMLALGVSFLLFFVVIGLMWTIGVFVIDSIFIEVGNRSFNTNVDNAPDSITVNQRDKTERTCMNESGGLTKAVDISYWRGTWFCTFIELEERIKTVLIWAVPILALFASIKMLVNASNRGQD